MGWYQPRVHGMIVGNSGNALTDFIEEVTKREKEVSDDKKLILVKEDQKLTIVYLNSKGDKMIVEDKESAKKEFTFNKDVITASHALHVLFGEQIQPTNGSN